MTPFIYDPERFDIYIGNDVDKKSFSLHIRERYRQIMTKKIPAQPEQLYNFIRRQFPNQKVVLGYEAGPTGFALHDYMVERQLDCVVMSPASIRKAPNQRVKTNRIDAQKISAMLTEGDFKPVRVPPDAYRELRHLVQTRENYVRGQRTAKQRIKALLLYTRLHTTCQDIDTHWSKRYLEHLRKLECPSALRFRLDRLLEDLDYQRGQLLRVTKELRLFSYTSEDIQDHRHNLQTIPGIGLITATTLLARIGDPRHLQGLRELGAFCGLVPREHSTGDKVNRGSITHLGDGVLRSLLVEAAWSAIKKDTELKQFFDRIVNPIRQTESHCRRSA